ncbi:hypothetical protein HMN09_00800600 [Mycena chlorophos]|uniref:F-box domain-containing protein n=1 Tax=Mycena chlorophos TaxID=658473 RepID=A0A8H6W8F3_MYCCL|nr:hypothetical protein HMN09_00800600 [Mycena chlorophos]
MATSEPTEPESVASQVFSIPELLLLVLSHLAPTGKRGSMFSIDTQALASLSRVSRATSEAALDALWRRMYRPDAFVRLLPEDAYCKGPEANAEFQLLRPLTEQDFAVFDKYAYRVHYVDFSNSSAKLRRGCEVFPHFKDFRFPLLPLLKEFRWEASVYSIGALYLISPRGPVPSEHLGLLLWGEIDDVDEAGVVKQTIHAFNDPALPWLPDVERMSLRTLEFLPGVRDALRRLENVQNISFDLRADPLLFSHLATLPQLKSLDTRHLSSSALSRVDIDQACFPVLESLRLSGAIEPLSQCISLITSPQLSNVRLTPQSGTSAIPSSLLAALVPLDIPARTTALTRFDISAPHGRGSTLALDMAVFAPLHACHNLEVFRVDADPTTLSLTETDVHAMAAAWPRLLEIHIVPPHSAESSGRVSLYALWAFAVGCPDLRHLAIEVDANIPEPFAPPTGSDVVLPKPDRPLMTDFILFCAPCGDPEVVSAFIKLAFPNVDARAFQAYGTVHNPEDKKRWGKVTAALPIGDDASWLAPIVIM